MLPFATRDCTHLNDDVQVTATKTVKRTGKGSTTTTYFYQGTFITHGGALFVVPPRPRRSSTIAPGRDTEKKMLRVLCSTRLNPRADPSVARDCETPDGLRRVFSEMVRAAGTYPRQGSTETIASPPSGRRFDCLLLLGATRRAESGREGTMPPKVGGRINTARMHDKAWMVEGRALARCVRWY